MFLSLLALAVSGLSRAAEGGYNLPGEVAGAMPQDAVMKKMETAVKPEVLAEFKKQHPAKFWVFGEDRQMAVRNGVVPAHWFEPGATNYQHFAGTARPGEFYVFQTCIVPGEEDGSYMDCRVEIDSLPEAFGTVISGIAPVTSQNWSILVFGLNDKTAGRAVLPVWVAVQIPESAKPGSYGGKVCFRPVSLPSSAGTSEAFAETLSFILNVGGQPVASSGVDEAWRLARLKWLNSNIGMDDKAVTRPFIPVKLDEKARTIYILGRRVTIGPSGIPSQITSFFSPSNTKILSTGRDAFTTPPRFECLAGGRILDWHSDEFQFGETTPTRVSWSATNRSGELGLLVSGKLEFDGYLSLSMELIDNRGWDPDALPITVDEARFTVPWRSDVAKYGMGLGLTGRPLPEKHDWKWDVSKHQDAIWIGDVNAGAMMRFKGRYFERPLINAYYDFRPLELPDSWGSGGIRIERKNERTDLIARSGRLEIMRRVKGLGGFSFNTDWYLTPFKPLDVKQHFTDRYYHIGQHAGLEDTAKLKADGANIIEIHHNRLCNPYINYPFNDDSLPKLKEFVKKAHGDGMRVNLYYTTRELTQNLPEFFALKSMGGEIILPRKEGVAWPVTNPQGPHPWLREHVGEDIVPAWRENLKFPEYPNKLDLAVITTPDSRWNNFYLEGLDYLIKNAGIDGLYIDDTALDRVSMQRARRILDADGNTGRRVNMHSWNHHNGLAKWSNSSIAFMELYPYYDGLWHGEGFNADSPPEFMLVEMSGIPFGLMSEMLDHPNPWHGMVFGMRVRWPWSGDPRPIWKLEDRFGIADSEFIGWWDPACPVKTGHPQVKASVFRKSGSAFIAMASWAKEPVTVKPEVDWKALGIDPGKGKLLRPECANLQTEAAIDPAAGISIDPNKGCFLIAE
ncbi:MAG: hypothetical protein J0M04_20850 [Verrucomicrobia bacterium]|nr:hypothetical protein [Verrucomicrobiota bacterium]